MKYKLLVICTIGSSTVRVIKLLIILVTRSKRKKRQLWDKTLYMLYF